MPHSSMGLRPSSNSVKSGVSACSSSSSGAVLGVAQEKAQGGGSGGGESSKSKSGSNSSSGGKSATSGAVVCEEEEVSVSKWRHGLSEEGLCRAHLIDRLPWMSLDPRDSEGTLNCPGCGTKVGQYSLTGLKCSCGLYVTPAFKLPRAKVDAMVQGEGALEASLHAAELEERAGVLETGVDGEAGEGGEDGLEAKEKRGKRMAAPVSKHKGNFSSFRNKTT